MEDALSFEIQSVLEEKKTIELELSQPKVVQVVPPAKMHMLSPARPTR